MESTHNGGQDGWTCLSQKDMLESESSSRDPTSHVSLGSSSKRAKLDDEAESRELKKFFFSTGNSFDGFDLTQSSDSSDCSSSSDSSSCSDVSVVNSEDDDGDDYSDDDYDSDDDDDEDEDSSDNDSSRDDDESDDDSASSHTSHQFGQGMRIDNKEDITALKSQLESLEKKVEKMQADIASLSQKQYETSVKLMCNDSRTCKDLRLLKAELRGQLNELKVFMYEELRKTQEQDDVHTARIKALEECKKTEAEQEKPKVKRGWFR